jgi:hypothetical protein
MIHLNLMRSYSLRVVTSLYTKSIRVITVVLITTWNAGSVVVAVVRHPTAIILHGKSGRREGANVALVWNMYRQIFCRLSQPVGGMG